MEPQFINAEDGTPLYVLLSTGEYERLERAAEHLSDIEASGSIVSPQGLEERLVPVEVAHRIASGDNPVRVWREHRGLRGVELARGAGISPAYLSEIETGKKEGTFRTMTVLAGFLDISLDDLAPVISDEDKAVRERQARIDSICASLRRMESLVSGDQAFDTGAVREVARILRKEADELINTKYNPEGWLDEVLRAADGITALISRAEGQIVETAQSARGDLKEIVISKGLQRPREEPKAARANSRNGVAAAARVA